MYAYEVGKKIISPCQDGVIFNMTDEGGVLLICFSNPTAKEKQEFKDGLSLRFTVVNDIIFVLSRMGISNWMDSPYYRYYKGQNPKLPEVIEDGIGLSVHVMFIDAANGTLVAQKLIGCKTLGSRKLVEAIKSQPIINNYDQLLNITMMQYSTSKLVQNSTILF